MGEFRIPVELIALGLTANFGVFSLIAHLQFAMYRKVSDVATQHTTETAVSKERIAATERHLRRNEEEMSWMRKHYRAATGKEPENHV